MKTNHTFLIVCVMLLLSTYSPVSAQGYDYYEVFRNDVFPANSDFIWDVEMYTNKQYANWYDPNFFLRSGGGNENILDPTDPDFMDPNNGSGTGISVLSPVGDGFYVFLFPSVLYMVYIVYRSRKKGSVLS